MCGAETGDAVDDQQSLGVFLLEKLCNTFNIVTNAGRRLRRLDKDGAGLELESGFDLIEVEGLAIRFFDYVGVAAKVFYQGRPALAKFARRENEDAVSGRGEVGDRSLHGAGAAAGEDEDVVFRVDELL